MEAILSYIIFMPLFTALLLGLSAAPLRLLRLGAGLSSVLVFALVAVVATGFDPEGGMQFVRTLPWIAHYGITYHVGVDALSLVLLLLIAFLMPLLYVYMWKERRKGYWINMMLLQTGVTGAVLSLDMLLFYLFWETMLLPIFIMIGRYGNGMHQFNAMKIVLMTVMGSMSMLFSIFYLGYEFFKHNGWWSFALSDLSGLQFDLAGRRISACLCHQDPAFRLSHLDGAGLQLRAHPGRGHPLRHYGKTRCLRALALRVRAL